MSRSWWLAAIAGAALCAGCSQNEVEMTAVNDEPFTPLSSLEPAGNPYETSTAAPAATDPIVEARPETAAHETPVEPVDISPANKHVVSKGDTLYKLARQYYGDASRWRDIYNANRDVIRDPNILLVGAKLVIP